MLPEGWKRFELGNVLDVLTGFAFSSESYVPQGPATVRLLRGDNVMQGWVRWDDAVHHPGIRAELERFSLRLDDVVIALDRPITKAGLKCSVIKAEDIPSLLVQRVARLRTRNGLSQSLL